jgi:hypothetical protein
MVPRWWRQRRNKIPPQARPNAVNTGKSAKAVDDVYSDSAIHGV